MLLTELGVEEAAVSCNERAARSPPPSLLAPPPASEPGLSPRPLGATLGTKVRGRGEGGLPVPGAALLQWERTLPLVGIHSFSSMGPGRELSVEGSIPSSLEERATQLEMGGPR